MSTPTTHVAGSELAKITHEELPLFLLNAAMNQRPLFIHGRTGIGKTTSIHRFAEEIGCKHVLDRRPANEDVTELAGFTIPDLESFITRHCPPEWSMIETPDEEPIIVIFEEITSVRDTAMQSMLYEVLQERTLRGRKFSPNWIFIGTGNLKNEDGLVFPIPAPLLNRFMHVELINDADNFVRYGRRKNMHPMVLAWISHKGTSELHHYVSGEYAFRTNRTWEEVSKTLYNPLIQIELKNNFGIDEVIPESVVNDFNKRNKFVNKSLVERFSKGVDSEFLSKSIASIIGSKSAIDFVNFVKTAKHIMPVLELMFDKNGNFDEKKCHSAWADLDEDNLYILIEYVSSRLVALREKGENIKKYMKACAHLISFIKNHQDSGVYGGVSRKEFVIGFYQSLNEASENELILHATQSLNGNGADADIMRHIMECNNTLKEIEEAELTVVEEA
ncbi:ATP-binding protein [Proteus mirabilis]|uniref:ATP-binding protein n=1 Tax=Proteus mirabilis TaxID=584 RepID=UPI0034D67423